MFSIVNESTLWTECSEPTHTYEPFHFFFLYVVELGSDNILIVFQCIVSMETSTKESALVDVDELIQMIRLY